MTDTFLMGDMVLAVTGEHAGHAGCIIRIMGKLLTVLRGDGRAFDIPATDCRIADPERGQHEND